MKHDHTHGSADAESQFIGLRDEWSEELVTGPARELGGPAPDSTLRGVKMWIGRRPFVRTLVGVDSTSKEQFADKTEQFQSRYSMYLVLFSIAALSDGEGHRLEQLEFGVEYADDPNKSVTVSELIPERRFVRTLEGRVEYDATLDSNGRVTATDVSACFGPAKAEGGVTLQQVAKASLTTRLAFAVGTTSIQAIGKGHRFSQWAVARELEPLEGRDHVFGHVIIVPRNVRRLSARLWATGTVAAWWPGSSAALKEASISCDIELKKASGDVKESSSGGAADAHS